MDWLTKIRTLLHRPDAPRASEMVTRLGEGEPTVTLDAARQPAVAGPIWQRRYRTIRKLGEGGMGSAFLAVRQADSVEVCLKFLQPDTDRRAVEQECRALMRLRHHAIIAMLDFSLEDSPPWLAMEYAEGHTLAAHLKQHAPLGVSAAAEILQPLLEALDHAHGLSVIHRDLKPANIVIDVREGRQRTRILDFGIALVDQFDHEGRRTAQGADPVGTLHYMAPEQLQGMLLTPACDLYAVGLMSWEMLMGRSPFHKKTAAQMMYEKVTNTQGLRLDEAPAPVASELGQFIEACTQANPELRPTARDGLAVLQSLTGQL